MNYLIAEIWTCLLIAASIGAVLGWLLKGIFSHAKLKELENSWQQKLDNQEIARTETKHVPSEPVNEPPKTDSVDAPTTKAIQTSYDVEEIEGIGSNFGAKLRDLDIVTTQQLLNKCCDLDGRIEIANHIGIEDFVIQKWASMADLMRISEIDGQFAELAVFAGIDSVEDLAKQEASTFFNTITKLNDEQQRVETLPTRTSLEIMIAEANSLPPKLKDI